jgi:hypothetical protein
MGCDAILLDVTSGGDVASNQIVGIGFGACVVEHVVAQGEIVFGKERFLIVVAQISEARPKRSIKGTK